jgi:hypothetical protein
MRVFLPSGLRRSGKRERRRKEVRKKSEEGEQRQHALEQPSRQLQRRPRRAPLIRHLRYINARLYNRPRPVLVRIVPLNPHHVPRFRDEALSFRQGVEKDRVELVAAVHEAVFGAGVPESAHAGELDDTGEELQGDRGSTYNCL